MLVGQFLLNIDSYIFLIVRNQPLDNDSVSHRPETIIQMKSNQVQFAHKHQLRGSQMEDKVKILRDSNIYRHQLQWMFPSWQPPVDGASARGQRWQIQFQIPKITGCACAGNAGNAFPATDFKRNHKLAILACITARASHVPWCMSGSLTRGGGENDPSIPGAWATHTFAYVVRGQDPRYCFSRLYIWCMDGWI